MATLPISVLFLCTPQSRTQLNKDFKNILRGLEDKEKFTLEQCETYDDASRLLKRHEFKVVIVHFLSTESTDLWRRIFYKTRAHNKYSEVIVIVADQDPQDKIEAGQVLSGGCFAFFQYTFSKEVLFGYIEAANRKYEIRQRRAKFSLELNGDVYESGNSSITVDDVAIKVASLLYEITEYNNITITLLKKGRTGQGYLRKLVHTNLSRNNAARGIKWQLLKPTDEDELIKRILLGKIERRIFSNPRKDEDIKTLFDVENETPKVNSWIALPLRHAGIPIGLITIDGFEEDWFNYEKINELFLEQIANQAAASIRYAEKDEVHQRLGNALNALNSSIDLNEILKKLAEQACKLVGGLFSYIVVPDQAHTRLEFRGAWSQDDEDGYIKKLENTVVFPDPNNDVIKKPGFLLPPYNKDVERKGITTIAYTTGEIQLLENIRDENYQEISDEAKNSYYPFYYLRKEKNGRTHRIESCSDIALPIFLDEENLLSSTGNRRQVLGVINVEHEDPFAFTKEQISALQQLAEFAAIAIQNRKNQDFVNELYELSDFAYSESITFNQLESYLDDVANTIRKVTKATRVTVHSAKDNKSIFIGQTEPKEPHKKGSRWGDLNKEGHTFWSVRNNKPVVIYDTRKYQESPESYKDIFNESYLREDGTAIWINEETTDLEKIKALVCIPMALTSQDAIGVIWMLHEINPNYSKQEINLLIKFASKIANTLNVVEKITFLKIENEINITHDKEAVLKKIVDMAKDYFGLRGATIYEANHLTKTLKLTQSNISSFLPFDFISFNENTPQGLSGHVMLGIDKGGYPYASGFCPVEEYTQDKYPHAMNYDAQGIQELGSVVGIRMPANSSPNKAVGVLIIADEVGRKYIRSKENLLKFADIAGKCLQTFQDAKAERNLPDTKPIPELQKQLNAITSHYAAELKKSQQKLLEERRLGEAKDLMLSELEADIKNLKESVDQTQQKKSRLEKENFILRLIITFSLIIFAIYQILFNNILEALLVDKSLIRSILAIVTFVVAPLLTLFLWKNMKWGERLAAFIAWVGLIYAFIQTF